DECAVASLRSFLATLEETESQLDGRTELEEACRIYSETAEKAEKAETLYHACKAASFRDEVALCDLAALARELLSMCFRYPEHIAEELETLVKHREEIQKLHAYDRLKAI